MKKKLAIFLISCLCISEGFSQSFFTHKIVQSQTTPLVDYLLRCEKTDTVRFYFMDEWLEGFTIGPEHNGQLLSEVVDSFLAGSDVYYVPLFDYGIIFLKDPQETLRYQSLVQKARDEKKVVEKMVMGEKRKLPSTTQLSLKGVVLEDSKLIPLQSAEIILDGKSLDRTDERGRFSVLVTAGKHLLSVKLLNYVERVIELEIYESGSAEFLLQENPTFLREIEVSDEPIDIRRFGQHKIKMVDLKRSPTFLGEVDIIKKIQSEPGVTTVGEVASGFNVRGGGVDQNLVLLDGVPVFNTSHALGFFTAFNSDAVDNVTFYKGGIPAQYGGRVSSVLDITSKEGDKFKWKGAGGIGIISSYATLEGPIIKDRTTIMASVRGSYSDWMLRTIRSNYANLSQSSVSFHDAIVKLAHRINDHSKLSISTYSSSDQFQLTNDTTYQLNNRTTSIRYDHAFPSTNLSMSGVLSFGEYQYQVSEPEAHHEFEMGYGVRYPAIKIDFDHEGRHRLSFGLQSTLYQFDPGYLKSGKNSSMGNVSMQHERSLESAIHFTDVFQWTDKISIEGGIRLSMYNRVGAGVEYLYANDRPREVRNITDSVHYASGRIMKTYHGLEPRLSMKYKLSTNASIKWGYNRIFQYLHLITNTSAITPTDIWQSSNAHFKPQIADQLSIGYYHDRKGMYEASLELYFKLTQNTLDFKDGAQLLLNKHIETALIPGFSKAYGTEFSVSKKEGRLQGTMNYTLSRSLRKSEDKNTGELINRGKYYASNYDQPHVLNLNFRYGLSRRIFFSGNFTYHSGRPISLPTHVYEVDGVFVQSFSERNAFRIPDYHRLDLALIVEGNHKRKKVLDGKWVISFYNIYARQNAYSVFFREGEEGLIESYKLSVIGTVIPSLSYSFQF